MQVVMKSLGRACLSLEMVSPSSTDTTRSSYVIWMMLFQRRRSEVTEVVMSAQENCDYLITIIEARDTKYLSASFIYNVGSAQDSICLPGQILTSYRRISSA
jgi:hypothetical protein